MLQLSARAVVAHRKLITSVTKCSPRRREPTVPVVSHANPEVRLFDDSLTRRPLLTFCGALPNRLPLHRIVD